METFGSDKLRVEFDADAGVFDVTHTPTGVVWKMDRSDRRDVLVRTAGGEDFVSLADARKSEVGREGESFLRARYAAFEGVEGAAWVELRLTVQGEDLLVEIDAWDSDPRALVREVYYPRAFLLPADDSSWALLPRRQGVLLPGSDRKELDGRLGWKPRLNCYGGFADGCGLLAVAETPHDLRVAHMCGPEGHRLFPRWMASLGRFRYPRRLRLLFRKATGLDGLAREYRKHAEREGWCVTLAEKAEANERVNLLKGCGVLSELIAYVDRRRFRYDVRTFAEARERFQRFARASGAKRLVYHLDGWGAQGYDALHPDLLPPLGAAGGWKGLQDLAAAVKEHPFLFLLHDNYNLFFPDAASFHESRCVWDEDLVPFRDAFRAGGLNFVLCPEVAVDIVRRNYELGVRRLRGSSPPIMEALGPTAAYFDQFLISGGGVDECFNPGHLLSRRDYRRAMLEILRYLREELRLVVSVEHVYDWGVPYLDFDGTTKGANLAADPGVGVPFFSMVFHDCMVLPVGIDGHTPGAWQERILDGAVSGGVPYVFMVQHPTPEDASKRFKCAEVMMKLHERVAFERLVSHRLLSADGRARESEFESASVRVDYDERTVEINGADDLDGRYKLPVDGEPEEVRRT